MHDFRLPLLLIRIGFEIAVASAEFVMID